MPASGTLPAFMPGQALRWHKRIGAAVADERSFIIVGAGQAGGSAALTLRAEGFAGRILLLGNEPHPPYERPPLSKEVLRGDASPQSAYLATHDELAGQGIAFANDPVLSIDRAARTVTCASGAAHRYDALFLTNGGAARRLPGLPESDKVFYLRSIEDAERLKQALSQARSVMVVGGGWIGLEVAASARQAGKEVTVLEAGPALCARSLPAYVCALLHDLHTANGVALHLNATAQFGCDASGVSASLRDGREIRADLAVVGIGLAPDTGLAQACGLEVADGVVTDAQGRTSDPHIFAAGDVANHPNPYTGTRLRLESWANAQNQARIAAKAALGHPDEYREIPWFWSDQYGTNLQILGMPPPDVAPAIRRYDDRRQTLFFVVNGQLRGAIALNAGRDIRTIKRWMQTGALPAPQDLLDATRDLTKLPVPTGKGFP